MRQRDAIDALQSRGVNTHYTDSGMVSSLPLWLRARWAALDFIDSPRYLDGSRSLLTDSDLELLVRIPKLTRLDLDHTAITDTGALRLRDLKSLRELDLTGTNISDVVIAALQQSLPNCRIRH